MEIVDPNVFVKQSITLGDPLSGQTEIYRDKTGASSISILRVAPRSRTARHYHEATDEVCILKSGKGFVVDQGTKIDLVPDVPVALELANFHTYVNLSENENLVVYIFYTPAISSDDQFVMQPP